MNRVPFAWPAHLEKHYMDDDNNFMTRNSIVAGKSMRLFSLDGQRWFLKKSDAQTWQRISKTRLREIFQWRGKKLFRLRNRHY
jgi:hypothetical protein